MQIIYTDSPREPLGSEVYRLLNPFFGVVSAATSVIIEGEAGKHIESAYRAAGVPVSLVAPESDLEAGVNAAVIPEQMSVASLREYLKGLGIEPKAKATKAELLELLAEQE